MVYDPSSFSGLTRQVLGQLFPHYRLAENENAGREQAPLYRGGKNVTPNAAPPKPHERLLPTPEGGPTTNYSWLEDVLPGGMQLASESNYYPNPFLDIGKYIPKAPSGKPEPNDALKFWEHPSPKKIIPIRESSLEQKVEPPHPRSSTRMLQDFEQRFPKEWFDPEKAKGTPYNPQIYDRGRMGLT